MSILKLNNTTYKNIAKDNPKDLVEVIYGDDKDLTKFQPQQKIQRWDNEANVSIRLIEDKDELKEIATIIEEDGKIKHIKSKRECHFYNIQNAEHPEGASEFEVILKSDPRKKKGEDYTIEFSLEDKDVNYFYQPVLTPKEIAEGANRPENVEGSYAIYAKTPKTNWVSPHLKRKQEIEQRMPELQAIIADRIKVGGYTIDYSGTSTKEDLELIDLQNELVLVERRIANDTTIYKEYKCGKIGHIPFPYMIDANGWKVRAKDLNINQTEKRLRVVVPADFLDNAAYPVRHAAGLTFGWGQFGSSKIFSANYVFRGGDTVSPASNGTGVSMSIYSSGVGTIKMALYNGTTLIDYTAGITTSSGADWDTDNLVLGASVSTAVAYSLAFKVGTSPTIYYDTSATGNYNYAASTYANVFPNPITWNTTTVKDRYSIYATYTAGGGGNPVQPNHLFSLMGCGN